MNRLNFKNIFTLFILIHFVGQASASVVLPCSQTMKMSQSVFVQNAEVDHKMMDHSQHQLMVMTAHNEMNENVDNCCTDNCLCDMANCNGSPLINSVIANDIQHNFIQTKTVFLEKLPQSQYLNYLFKPPILS